MPCTLDRGGDGGLTAGPVLLHEVSADSSSLLSFGLFSPRPSSNSKGPLRLPLEIPGPLWVYTPTAILIPLYRRRATREQGGEMEGTRCVLAQPWSDPSRVSLSLEPALLLPLLSSVYCFCKGSCLPQKTWLMLGPPVVPKGHGFFCFLSLFLQGQT